MRCKTCGSLTIGICEICHPHPVPYQILDQRDDYDPSEYICTDCGHTILQCRCRDEG